MFDFQDIFFLIKKKIEKKEIFLCFFSIFSIFFFIK